MSKVPSLRCLKRIFFSGTKNCTQKIQVDLKLNRYILRVIPLSSVEVRSLVMLAPLWIPKTERGFKDSSKK